MDYLIKLEHAMIEQGHKESYIELCVFYAKRLYNQGLPVVFDKEHLCKLMGIDILIFNHYLANTDNFYHFFNIPKKSGGYRKIDVPSLNLKMIQRWILENVVEKIAVSEKAYGFRKDRNIVDNARIHTSKKVVFNVDIKDFFPSISRKDIFYIFYDLGYTIEVSYIFSKLCTYKEYLPHGSPTSPYLANIRCLKLDFSLTELCKRMNADYSRYADDITISSNDKYKMNYNINVIKKIIENDGFCINKKKERIQYNNQMQEVTGLIVNDGIKVRRKFKKEIEKHIYYCKKFGVYSHLSRINKGHISFYKEHLYGKVYFVKMVEPEIGEKYLMELDSINWDI